jgi:mono/diheme cytochrome c family protein
MGALLLVQTSTALAAPPAQTPEEGQAIFQELCSSCHTVGGGDVVGPDLEGVTTRREQEWLTQWLLAPDEMLDQQDPIAVEMLAQFNNIPMPNFGLSTIDVANLIAYFETPDVEVPTTTAPPAIISAGDPDIGKSLFIGTSSFQSGMASCIACHSIAGIGALGGGTLGPDLTQSISKYGGSDGMAAILDNIPFPTMMAVFGDDLVLTPEEQANVRAFLEQASVAQRPVEAVWQLAGLALAGLAILLGLSHLIWRRRIHKIRQPMVARQKARS